MLPALADRLGVPYCAWCDRPLWVPVFIFSLTYLGRRYHGHCYTRMGEAERWA